MRIWIDFIHSVTGQRSSELEFVVFKTKKTSYQSSGICMRTVRWSKENLHSLGKSFVIFENILEIFFFIFDKAFSLFYNEIVVYMYLYIFS